MPTYEYTCKRCGETLEVFQSFSEKPLRRHEECGGDLKKVFHARGVVFKGSGFYSTDSRSSNSGNSGKKAESGKEPAKADKASKAGSKSDSSAKAVTSTSSSD
jgi:putative FmdB family regulatory protein